MGQRVLVVDDDATITDVVARYLTRSGFDVTTAPDGISALQLVETEAPDLIVLDLMLPGMSGLDVCRTLRATQTVPILMLTALADAADRIVGLEFGADDYLTKPFDPRELVLRVEAILRRTAAPAAPPSSDVLRDGGLVVDLAAHTAVLDDLDLALTTREFDLLVHLMRHPGSALGRTQLMNDVWGWSFGDDSTVTVHIRRLREKIEPVGDGPRRIVTVFGVGYRFDPVGETATAPGSIAADADRR